MTLWRARIGCWAPKATNEHTEYAIHIAFPRQQWLHELASVLRYTCIVCFVYYYITLLYVYCRCLTLIPYSLQQHKTTSDTAQQKLLKSLFTARSVRTVRELNYYASYNDNAFPENDVFGLRLRLVSFRRRAGYYCCYSVWCYVLY
jgi:hypothetical protein